MKKLINYIAVGLMVVMAVGCSRETVPPASKGKLLSASGYSADVKEPGKYWTAWWNNMVILDTSTQTMKETITVKMKDNLDLTFDVRFRTRIGGGDESINAMFNDIKHDRYQVTLPMVYKVYGQDVVRTTSRSVMSKYNTEEVPQNFDVIVGEIREALSKNLVNSPLEMSNATLGDIKYPDVITKAIEAQSERRLAIETEQNQQAIEIVKKENQLELAEANREIRLIRAETIRDENTLTAEGLNPMLIQYRQLEVMERMAENENAVFIPYEALTNVGVSNKMFNQ